MILPSPMELVVILTSSLRVILVGFLFFLNYKSLLKVFSGRITGVHKVIASVVYSANLCYLFTWVPFVIYGIFNGTTMYFNTENYCKTQTLATNVIGSLFMVLLSVHGLEQIRVQVLRRKPLETKTSLVLTLIIWLLPHIPWQLWKVKSDRKSIGETFHFIDDVIRYRRVTKYRFKLDADNFTGSVEYTRETETETVVDYKVGFLICEMELNSGALDQFNLHYLQVVVPIAVLSAVCGLALWIHRCVSRRTRRSIHLPPSTHTPTTTTTPSAVFECHRGCSQLVIIDLVLCANWAWQSVIHPLMLVHAFTLVHGSPITFSAITSAGFLDIGSHLVLTISVVFAPSQSKKSWFSSGHVPSNVYIIDAQDRNTKIDTEQWTSGESTDCVFEEKFMKTKILFQV